MIRRTTTVLLVTAGLAGGCVTDALGASGPTGAAGLAPGSNVMSGGAGLTAAVTAKPKPKAKGKTKSEVKAQPKAKVRPKPKARPKVKAKPKAHHRAVRKPKPQRAVKPAPRKRSVPRPVKRVTPLPVPAPSGVSGADILAYAQRFTGTPYVYGANGPDTFDCSGFTSYVFAHFGYHLERTSYDQMTQGVAVHGPLQVGDLVFWDDGGHVGIYAGHDSFISATVHRGIWTYSFDVWRQSQSYTTARRIIGARTLAAARDTGAGAARAEPRNGGPADATP